MQMAVSDMARAKRQKISSSKRWVVKIGSALLTENSSGLHQQAMTGWARQVAQLMAAGRSITLVSSGAVAEGLIRLDWSSRPREIARLQAAAAVGQSGLIRCWEEAFSETGRIAAQVLLSGTDIQSRQRYLNARAALHALLSLGAVPIINENDTVATEEIRLGDNDTLAGQVVNLLDADLLVILTDQAGLCEEDPRHNPKAQLVEEADVQDPRLRQAAAGSAGELGRGGMITKLQAAEQAARSGADTIIADGRMPEVLYRVAAGEAVGTLLKSGHSVQAARKNWLVGLPPSGALVLDDGAVLALCKEGRSLLPVGVVDVQGEFERGDTVSCLNAAGTEVARGLANYGAAAVQRILGCASSDIEQKLGYRDEEELIHRNNLVLL